MRTLAGRSVSEIAYGGALLSFNPNLDPAAGIARIRCALDSGIRVLDTAAAYCPDGNSPGHNEMMMATAMREWGGDPDEVLVVTKGGHQRSADGFPIDGRPEAIARDCEGSLRALGSDVIGLYLLHWPDPEVPIQRSAEGLRALLEAGKIGAAGISNVTVEQLRAAQTECPIAAVQNPFSPGRAARDMLDVCTAEGIGFMAYSPLGGPGEAAVLGERYPAFAAVAERHGVSPQRAALAWEVALSPVLLPVCGATRPETIRDSAAAMSLELTDGDRVDLDRSSHPGVGL